MHIGMSARPDRRHTSETESTASMFKRRLDLWLPTYAMQAPRRLYGALRRRTALTHVIFLVCDHFEPRHAAQTQEQPFERMQAWHDGYARFQQRCMEAFGTRPLHTWFYPPHHGDEHLARLANMVYDGLGEVELHYHHDGDTSETFRRDLRATLAEYNRWGLLLESGRTPRTSFGFIHGDWALDNSCHGRYCGVNDELTILSEHGCWGDFTMPSANECQTRKINAVYYAIDDPQRPKSHNWGRDARVGSIDPDGFFLMQGPLAINWRAPGYPRIENANLTFDNWGRADRIQRWIDCQVHVRGRPEWLFVKLHTHGAIERDFDALFGERAFEMHRVLNERYNDGERFRLHYVTARQAYNIAKAAEHGKTGDPSQWRDFVLQPQVNSRYCVDARHKLTTCTEDHLALVDLEAAQAVTFRTAIGPASVVVGRLSGIEVDGVRASLRLTMPADATELKVRLNRGWTVSQVSGARVVGTSMSESACDVSLIAEAMQVEATFMRG